MSCARLPRTSQRCCSFLSAGFSHQVRLQLDDSCSFCKQKQIWKFYSTLSALSLTGANGMSGSGIKGYSMRCHQWVLCLSTTIIKPLLLLCLRGPLIMSLISLDALPPYQRAVTGHSGHRQIVNIKIWPNSFWSLAFLPGTRVTPASCLASTPGRDQNN